MNFSKILLKPMMEPIKINKFLVVGHPPLLLFFFFSSIGYSQRMFYSTDSPTCKLSNLGSVIFTFVP